MKAALLTLKLLFWGYVAYLVVFLLTGYRPQQPGYDPPLVIWILDLLNLFIHEAGHLVFRLFGMWMHMIGGSLFQVLLPLALLIVTARQKPRQIGLPAFWTGESMVNLSVYIRDAPVRKLKLIAQGLIHDWNWILSDNLEAAEPLADIVYWMGLLICTGGVAAGVFYAVNAFRNEPEMTIPE